MRLLPQPLNLPTAVTHGLRADELIDLIAAAIAEKVIANLRTNPTTPVKLYNIKQVAEMTGRSKSSVQHLIGRGELPSVKIGRRVQVAAADLENWIERNKDGNQ